MYSSKITVIEISESIDSVYNSYEEYEAHTLKLRQRGYSQIGFTTNGINNKVYASHTRRSRKEIIPRIVGNNHEI